MDLQTELTIMELYESGLNDYEISQRTGLSKPCIWSFRNKRGLKSVKRKFIEQLMDLYKQGLTIAEMSLKTGKPQEYLLRWHYNHRIRPNKPRTIRRSYFNIENDEIRKEFYKTVPRDELVIMGVLSQLLHKAKELNKGKITADMIGEVLKAINKDKVAI